jgi:hypothetical protein
MDSTVAPKNPSKGARVEPSPGFDLKNPLPLTPGCRVRVVSGPLLGLTGTLTEQDVSARWLLQADYAAGVFVRADASTLEIL